ncbi:MAG: DUF169 domain-containing protein [Methanosphaera sp.]|nr:DUF169 domain-containing protein [Methanosphaera sp.]
MSPCKIDDYKTVAKQLTDLVGLDKSPVAVKLVSSLEDVGDLPKIDDKIRHCEMVYKAASEKKVFYATLDEQLCQGGAAALGLRDFPKPLITGKKYYSLGRFASEGSAKHELDQVPKVDTIMEAVCYAPLEDAPFEADVVVLYCRPDQALKVAQANGYVLGKRFEASFAGIQSICADVVAKPYVDKEPNMSLGCGGSRKFTDIKPEELVVGLNMENLPCMINSLESLSK